MIPCREKKLKLNIAKENTDISNEIYLPTDDTGKPQKTTEASKEIRE
jgi:hypothetical protein